MLNRSQSYQLEWESTIPTKRSCRYVTKDTIEERMLALQERKRMLQEEAFAKRSAAEAREQRVADIRVLFGLAGGGGGL